MEKFSNLVQIRWSDIDQNRHLRHSVYYDYGAMIRIAFFNHHGLTAHKLEEFNIGPVIFREEAIFKREIRPEDQLTIDVELVKTTSDYSKWTFRHNFIKADGTVAAMVSIDGAWMDIVKRKITVPNEFIQKIFEDFPKSADFTVVIRN